MRLSPLDIYNKEFRQALNGYNRSEVDAFLEEVGRDYEALTRENIELKQQVEQMAKRLADYARLEESIRNALVLAQTTADEARASARREAETILEQARAQARQVEEDAARLRQQRERFLMEFETLLRSHLAALERETTAAR
ncbi:MAG: DivIVA domain-containing protein [Armatimonadota bacterium]|nr:DivIVA domain-containing protein [Armatimonadota bacterium]